MLFNPDTQRLSLNQMRNMVVNAQPQLKAQLDRCLRGKADAEETYRVCHKTETDQRAFDGEIKQWNEWIDRVDRTAYRYITHDLLLQEQTYGFGTPVSSISDNTIQVIPPNYWLFLELNPDQSEARGHGLHYAGIFIQESKDVPAETIALVKQWQSNTAIATPDPDVPKREAPTQKEHYISPYIRLMLEAAEFFDIDESDPPLKKIIEAWLMEHSAEKNPAISARLLDPMATFIRPPEAQKGGNRKQSMPMKGDTVKQPEDV